MTVATPAQRPAETKRKPYPTRQREKPLASSIRSTFPTTPPHPELDIEHSSNKKWLMGELKKSYQSIKAGNGTVLTREHFAKVRAEGRKAFLEA